MTSQSASQDSSPQKTYRLMATFAVLIILLLGGAIYSLSRMQTTPWASSLSRPELNLTAGKPLPPFQHSDEKSLSPAQLSGRWTLLSFWSYSCVPCLEEM